jgi:hypothetical protein
VARVKTPLQRRLEKLLTERFPPPASVQLQEHDDIFGVITSSQFAGVETILARSFHNRIIWSLTTVCGILGK